MRALILGLTICLALAQAPSDAWATEPEKFEILGLRPGMTLDQVKQVLAQQKLGSPKLSQAPSFDQKVALARNQRVSPSDYQGVQTLRAENGNSNVQVFFVAMPQGSVASKIAVEIFGGTTVRELSNDLASKYGAPGRETDLESVWGDAAANIYTRTAAYLEIRPSPASTGMRKPLAALVLADPAIERTAKEAVEKQARP